MVRSTPAALLALLVFAGSAAATTVGEIKGRPLAGQPLEVNIPFAVDEAKDRACASASVRYGNAPVTRATLHVQGKGFKRNLLVTSRAKVTDEPVTVSVRVGCGAKAVTRKFVMAAGTPAARNLATLKPAARPASFEVANRPAPKAVALPAGEPLFPPPAAEAAAPESSEPKPDASVLEDLRKARTDAAAALGQLESTRRELAAVLDVERRTQQTLINAEHRIQQAQSDAARMRLVLKWAGAAVTLAAAALLWWEFQRAAFRMRTARSRPHQEPTILASNEIPA